MLELNKPTVCLVGPSGIGKTSFAKRLVKELGFCCPRVVTTRRARDDDGKGLRYVTEFEFSELINDGEFLEWDTYTSYRYGTLISSIMALGADPLARGIILDVTPRGCLLANDKVFGLKTVLLVPDDPEWLRSRLIERDTQDGEEIDTRSNLLLSYLEQMETLPGRKVAVGYSPSSWDPTFEQILLAIQG